MYMKFMFHVNFIFSCKFHYSESYMRYQNDTLSNGVNKNVIFQLYNEFYYDEINKNHYENICTILIFLS